MKHLACAVIFSAAGTAQAPNDWLIVPGHRAGPIRQLTTIQDLKHIFGAENVTEQSVDLPEGNQAPGAIVFKGKRDEITIVWDEKLPGKRIDNISLCTMAGDKCRWHTQEGVRIGTTLKQLEKLNGRPFTLAGFDWDYSGAVVSFKGGNLELLRGKCGMLYMQLAPDSRTPANNKLVDQLQGDGEFSSSNPAMQALNPRVASLDMGFACVGTGSR